MIQVRLNDDAVFSFPFADGYWSLLLDPHYGYERDINLFFRSIARCRLHLGRLRRELRLLVDPRHQPPLRRARVRGDRAFIAKLCDPVVQRRIKRRPVPVRSMRHRRRGGTANLSGSKHEAMTIAGATQDNGETVEVIPLDSLLGSKLDANRRHVIKLDVEGVETEALRGGLRLLETDCVLICESARQRPQPHHFAIYPRQYGLEAVSASTLPPNASSISRTSPRSIASRRRRTGATIFSQPAVRSGNSASAPSIRTGYSTQTGGRLYDHAFRRSVGRHDNQSILASRRRHSWRRP